MQEESGKKWPWGGNPVMLLATGFGLGLSPVASGTVGTTLGIPIVLAWRMIMGSAWSIWELAFALVLTLVAVPICGRAEKRFGKEDDGRIVADEYMTFPICMLGLPSLWWVFLVAFMTNRFFDILKPPPAYQLQSLHGGWGIVLDDVMAAIYSLMVNHMVYWGVLYLTR